MFGRPIRIEIAGSLTVNIPSVDRVVDLIQGAQQAEIDSLNAKLQALEQRFGTSQSSLQAEVDQQPK